MGCGCKNKQKGVTKQTSVTKPSNPVRNGATGTGSTRIENRRVQKRIIR